jgi:hypothetical protein
VDDFGENFERLDQTRSWSIEKPIAIGQVHSAVLYGTQTLPTRPIGERRHFAAGPLDAESAGQEDHNLRVAFANGPPVQPR